MSQDIASPDRLQEEVLRRIAARGGTKRYRANAVIINEGDTGDSLFILLSGRVKVYASNAAGKEVVITTHGPGEYVGELALDGGVRSASVMTLEPTTCSVIAGVSLREFIEAHPDFAQHLIHKLIRRVRHATDSVKMLALEDVYGRVIRLLHELSESVGAARVVPERLTHQAIADRIGSSREMVSRILKGLKIGGYVSVVRGRLTIHRRPPAAW